MTYFLAVSIPMLLIAALWVTRLQQKKRQVSKETLLSKTFTKILDGEREEVLEDMRLLYRETEQDVSIGLALGVLLRQLGKHQLAIRTHLSLTHRQGLDPDFKALIFTELCADYLASGLLDRAQGSLTEALALKKADELMARNGERLYIRLKEWESAYKLVSEYGKRARVEVSERLGLLRLEQGKALWEEGKQTEAFAALKKALTVHRACLPALLTQSRFLRLQGKPNRALKLILKQLPTFKDQHWLAIRELMHIAIDMDDHSEFLKLATKRIEEDASDWRSRSVLATFLMETGNYLEAAEALLLCLAASPQTLYLHQLYWTLMMRADLPRDIFADYQDQMRKDLVLSDPYECKACFYHSSRLVWNCPSCYRTYSFRERKI